MPVKELKSDSIYFTCDCTINKPLFNILLDCNPYNIVDVDVIYENKFITTVDPEQRDDKGNYKAERTTVKVPKKVVCTFTNGEKQTALCDEEDEFNLEFGISICLCKQLLHMQNSFTTDFTTDGTKKYNDIIRDGVKIYKHHLKKEEEIRQLEEAKKIKEASKQRRRLRKAEKKKEREIEILAEAIRRSRISE